MPNVIIVSMCLSHFSNYFHDLLCYYYYYYYFKFNDFEAWIAVVPTLRVEILLG